MCLISDNNLQKAYADSNNQPNQAETVKSDIELQRTNEVTLNNSSQSYSNKSEQQLSEATKNIQSNNINRINKNEITKQTTFLNEFRVSEGLDPNAYGTVNVNDWDYQKDNNILNITGYHGSDLTHIIIPNLNDFSNSNISVNGIAAVGISSETLKDILQPSSVYGYGSSWMDTLAISKTNGSYNKKVIAEDEDWSNIFNWKKLGRAIKCIDLTNLDTSKITNMSGMFAGQDELKAIYGLNSWNTHNVTDMSDMFNDAKHLENIGDLSRWDISNVNNLSGMFGGTSHLHDVGNLSDWNTSSVSNLSGMFADAGIRDTGDLGNWDTRNVTDMSSMFSSTGIQNVGDLGKWNTNNVTNMSGMFNAANIKNVGDLGKWNTGSVTNMSFMFDSTFIQRVGDLSKWDTSNVTDMSFMFHGTNYLHYVGDLSKWNTSKVTYMSNMFEDTPGLQNVGDLSKWNTSSVTNMDDIFNNSGINYFVASKSDYRFNNQIKVTDFLGEIGPTGSTVAVINVPTFYRKITGKSEAQSVYETVMPLVQEQVNEVYKRFYDSLSDDDKQLYPTTASLRMEYPNYIKNPSEVANARFDIDIEIAQRGDIKYVDQDGNVIKTDHLSGKVGDKIDVKIALPDGYELANKDEQIPSQVTVTSDGIPTVTIRVKKIPTVKTGVINYVDQDGNVLKTDHLSGKVGDKIDVKIALPDGYELADKDEQVPSQVTVTSDGIPTIAIRVKKIPMVKTGVINYVDQDGNVLKTDHLSGKVGDKIGVKIALPDGYELADKNEQIPSQVTVTSDGIPTVTIKVKKIPTVKTGVINYVDSNGVIVKTQQISGKVGSTIDVPFALPNGYKLADPNEQIPTSVIVNEDGIATIIINVVKVNEHLANNQVPFDSNTKFNQTNYNYGYLDNYKLTENSEGQAQLIVSGWHASGMSNDASYRYVIVYDNTLGHEIARQRITPLIRDDVQNAYPNVVNSRYSGFNITVDIPNNVVNHSLSVVSRYSDDQINGEGVHSDHWFGPLVMNETNQAWLDGLKTNDHILMVTGWHATNQAAGRPYHYIIAWDQNLGHEIARSRVTTVSRPDVANVYPTVANAVNSGFIAPFTLTSDFYNDNIQFISRWTDDAAGNGNAVDYWFNPITHINRAHLDSVNFSNGQLQVAGWHADDISQLEPNHYLIVFDNTTGQQVASQKVALLNSPDVGKVFSDTKTADHSRFNYAFAGLNLVPGHNYSLVSRYSADQNGNGNDGAHTDYWLNLGMFDQSAHYIDSEILRDKELTLQGWMCSDQSLTKPYAYAILLQNGHEIGRQKIGFTVRDDVARAYPRIYQSQNSGFNVSFMLPSYSTQGLQVVLRFTDDPAGNGNSADEWIAINPKREY
ncbi:lipoprotein [Limosilactobacillus secaliphilus]|uniref:Lipoprotein n=2 Tax=Limosilactobacillus secaliphilus TaxID=396268 RepID=A0A0R2I9C6_9LACO|nr:lipoprotein [Limosilactobacillus secaliphilus]